MTEWLRGNELQKRAAAGDLGGTMRLGAYPAILDARQPGRAKSTAGPKSPSATATATRSTRITSDRLEQHGMRFSGMSPDGLLPEIIEYADHPWFIGVQFHPELKSRPVRAAPAVRIASWKPRWSRAGWCRAPVSRA